MLSRVQHGISRTLVIHQATVGLSTLPSRNISFSPLAANLSEFCQIKIRR